MIYSHVFKSFPVCYGSTEITNNTVILAAEITQAHAWVHHVLSVRSSATHSITTQAAGASSARLWQQDKGRRQTGCWFLQLLPGGGYMSMLLSGLCTCPSLCQG